MILVGLVGPGILKPTSLLSSATLRARRRWRAPICVLMVVPIGLSLCAFSVGPCAWAHRDLSRPRCLCASSYTARLHTTLDVRKRPRRQFTRFTPGVAKHTYAVVQGRAKVPTLKQSSLTRFPLVLKLTTLRDRTVLAQPCRFHLCNTPCSNVCTHVHVSSSIK